MSWTNSKILRKYHFNKIANNNRNILLQLQKKGWLHLIILLNETKKDTAAKQWNRTLPISERLLSEMSITKRDQYYWKLVRCLRHTLYLKIIRAKLVIRSVNKQLRWDYRNGSNNIIGLYAENINLQSGFSLPPELEGYPRVIIKKNNTIIRETMKRIKE